jgi:hypothetical protein
MAMSSAVNDRVLVDVGASDFAFRASQLLERLLLDHGIQVACQAGSSIVAAEHVESCLDHALFDELLKRVRENSDGGTRGEGGGRDGQPREAA